MIDPLALYHDFIYIHITNITNRRRLYGAIKKESILEYDIATTSKKIQNSKNTAEINPTELIPYDILERMLESKGI